MQHAPQQFDLVIIGTGSANSIIGPEFDDWRIALVEEGVFGGTCLNRGCIPTKMLVHVADEALFRDDAHHLSKAIRGHFAHRRDEEARAIRSLLRQGRQALAIGIAFLFACGAAGIFASKALPPPVGSFVQEGLLIVGWVANWRPLEVFLYDWRPLRVRLKLYDALAQMTIKFRLSRESVRPGAR